MSTEFDNALESDFNTHLALSSFFQLVKEANRLAAEEKLGKEDAQIIKTELQRMLDILGLNIPEMTENEKKEIDNLIKNREQFRKEKQFEDADKIRDKLNELNIELIDHKGKTIWMKKEPHNTMNLRTVIMMGEDIAGIHTNEVTLSKEELMNGTVVDDNVIMSEIPPTKPLQKYRIYHVRDNVIIDGREYYEIYVNILFQKVG